MISTTVLETLKYNKALAWISFGVLSLILTNLFSGAIPLFSWSLITIGTLYIVRLSKKTKILATFALANCAFYALQLTQPVHFWLMDRPSYSSFLIGFPLLLAFVVILFEVLKSVKLSESISHEIEEQKTSVISLIFIYITMQAFILNFSFDIAFYCYFLSVGILITFAFKLYKAVSKAKLHLTI